ncbi:choice-of-anchor H family protein [Alteromonadaceae bacterium BrNp21-10]|nr:choice-of-anchor H family protein [Alteromonadaceae bacterium BrNp21-10]
MKSIVKLISLLSLTFAAQTIAADAIKVESVQKQFGEVVTESVNASAPKIKTSKSKLQVSDRAARNEDFWIYDAWATLERDTDYDGYYHYLTLEFDADTYYEQADMYAVLYLARGDVYEEYHVTDNFTIYGESSEDSYVVETNFLEGFPEGDYDVLIELYDAYNDELVVSYDGYNDDEDLLYLPLESKDYEYRTTTVTTEHGGSLGWACAILVIVLISRKQIS